MLLFLLLVVSFSCTGMHVKTRFKRERQVAERVMPQPAVADPAFLRLVCSGNMGLILPALHAVDVDAKGAGIEEVEFALRNESAVSLAIETGNIALAGLLLGKGANAHQVYKNGQTLLHKAVRRALNIPWYSDNWRDLLAPRLQLVDVLVAHKVDYSARDSDGYTVFHACAQQYAHEDAMLQEVAKTVFNALLVSIWLSQHPQSVPQEILAETKLILELPIFDKQNLADLACRKKCKKDKEFHKDDCTALSLCYTTRILDDTYKQAQEIRNAASLVIELEYF